MLQLPGRKEYFTRYSVLNPEQLPMGAHVRFPKFINQQVKNVTLLVRIPDLITKRLLLFSGSEKKKKFKGLTGATFSASITTEEQQTGECSNNGLTGARPVSTSFLAEVPTQDRENRKWVKDQQDVVYIKNLCL